MTSTITSSHRHICAGPHFCWELQGGIREPLQHSPGWHMGADPHTGMEVCNPTHWKVRFLLAFTEDKLYILMLLFLAVKMEFPALKLGSSRASLSFLQQIGAVPKLTTAFGPNVLLCYLLLVFLLTTNRVVRGDSWSHIGPKREKSFRMFFLGPFQSLLHSLSPSYLSQSMLLSHPAFCCSPLFVSPAYLQQSLWASSMAPAAARLSTYRYSRVPVLIPPKCYSYYWWAASFSVSTQILIFTVGTFSRPQGSGTRIRRSSKQTGAKIKRENA